MNEGNTVTVARRLAESLWSVRIVTINGLTASRCAHKFQHRQSGIMTASLQSRKESAVESSHSESVDEPEVVLSPRSIMRLQDALIARARPTKEECLQDPPFDEDGSTSQSSCETPPNAEESDLSMSLDSESSVGSCLEDLKVPSLQSGMFDEPGEHDPPSANERSDRGFVVLRITYLLVTLVIMLADGLQGML